jgi:hypothetical protein
LLPGGVDHAATVQQAQLAPQPDLVVGVGLFGNARKSTGRRCAGWRVVLLSVMRIKRGQYGICHKSAVLAVQNAFFAGGMPLGCSSWPSLMTCFFSG